MAQQYSLTCKNRSEFSGSFCIFQKYAVGPEGYPLAWLCKYCHPMVSAFFQWDSTPLFVWGETHKLTPDSCVFTAQAVPADAASPDKNCITLTKEDGAFHFIAAAKAGKPGMLTITTDQTIPNDAVAAGIGMAADGKCGTGAYLFPCGPNMSYTMQPTPAYYIAFGNYEVGQVLDFTQISCEPLRFPYNQFSLIAILLPDNTWQFELPVTHPKNEDGA